MVLITRALQRFFLSVVSSLQNLKDLLIQKIFLHVFPLQTGTMREASEKTMERVDWCPWKLKGFNWKLTWRQMQLVATVKLVKSTTTKENYTAVKVNLCPFLSSISINFYWPVHQAPRTILYFSHSPKVKSECKLDVALIVKQSSPSVWFSCLLASILPSVLNSLSFFYTAN